MHGLLTLLILLSGSFIIPVLSKRLHIPSAVLLIGFGILVGPAALNFIDHDSVVEFLFEVGFIVLMFLAGLEIDFNGIRSRGRGSLITIFCICLAIFGLAFLAAYLLDLHPIYGLALSATSVGLPLAILAETGRLRSAEGQRIILFGSVGEFITVIVMTLFYFTVTFGVSLQLLWGVGKLIAVMAVAGLFLRLLMATAWWYPGIVSNMVETEESSQIGVRAALMIMMAFAVLAVLAGLESIVGAFVAGALIAFVLRGKEVLEEKLVVVGHGLFIPIFFIIVGLNFDLDVISWPSLALAAKLLLAIILVRLLPCMFLLFRGLGFIEILRTSSLLSAPLTLLVAISAIGVELNVLSQSGQATLIILAVASAIVFPILFRIIGSGCTNP
jgi:Kef-type K+ transport system membrane component KefB